MQDTACEHTFSFSVDDHTHYFGKRVSLWCGFVCGSDCQLGEINYLPSSEEVQVLATAFRKNLKRKDVDVW